MRLPGFDAATSLYTSATHYRGIAASLQQPDAVVYSDLPVIDVTRSTLHFAEPVSSFLRDYIYRDRLAPLSVRECCSRCIGSFPCADESCRRQRLTSCNLKCRAEAIGGCDCPPDRVACTSSRAVGECCRSGEVCALDGCSPPNQICNGFGGCLGKCLPGGCCPPYRVVCNNECCPYGVKQCSEDGTCFPCGREGQPPCAGLTCKGDLHPNIDLLSNQLVCTASCGHIHQLACRTTYPVPGGVRSRYRCFSHTKLFATGPASPSNCMCVHNSASDAENDISDDSGFCISKSPGGDDIADPPDCEGADCTSKHEG